jgi:hypothetical protein
MDQKKQSLFLLRAYRTRYDMVWLPWFAAKEPAPWDSYGRIWDSRQRFIPSAGFPADMVSGSTWVAKSKLWRSQHQWPSMTINDHQWPSMSINDHQWPSMSINDHQWPKKWRQCLGLSFPSTVYKFCSKPQELYTLCLGTQWRVGIQPFGCTLPQ